MFIYCRSSLQLRPINKMSDPGTDTSNPRQVKCVHCAKKKRVTDVKQLEPGQHIFFNGAILMKNIGDGQKSPYTHHAIVTNVDALQDGTANVTLIHFYTEAFNSTIQIKETTELLCLSFSEIHIVEYQHETNSAADIVKEAKKCLKYNSKYHPLFNNCEHFCNKCAVGIDVSNQSRSCENKIIDFLASIASVSTKVPFIIKISRFFSTFGLFVADDTVASTIFEKQYISHWIAFFVVFGIFFVFTIFGNVYTCYRRREGLICAKCFFIQRRYLWIRFVFYLSLQAIFLSLTIQMFIYRWTLNVIIPSVVSLTLVTLLCWGPLKWFLKWFPKKCFPKRFLAEFYDKIISDNEDVFVNLVYKRPIDLLDDISGIMSVSVVHDYTRAHATKTLPISKTDQVEQGQIIEFNLTSNKLYIGICTRVESVHMQDSKLNLDVVYYDPEEYRVLKADLKDVISSTIKIHRCHPVFSYKTDEVVKRAIAEIGTRQRYLKPQDFTDKIVRKELYQKVESLSELKLGDAISVHYVGNKNKTLVYECDAIIVKIENNPNDNNVKRVTIIYAETSCCFFSCIKKIIVELSLAEYSVLRKTFTGFVTYPNDVIVERAQSVFEDNPRGAFNNSPSEFVHWAVVVQEPAIVAKIRGNDIVEEMLLLPRYDSVKKKYFQRRPVRSRLELKEGLIIEWGKCCNRRQGIITKVGETRSRITVSVYSKKCCKYSVGTEDKVIDLRQEGMWIYHCDPTMRNPLDEIVFLTRLRRLGGCSTTLKRCLSPNSSWNFCRDCVLNQIIQCLKDIRPGDPISFYYEGSTCAAIVTGISVPENAEQEGKFKVIRFVSYQSASTIKEEEIHLSLQKNKVLKKVFRGIDTYSNEDVVIRAKGYENKKWETPDWLKSINNVSCRFVYWAVMRNDSVTVDIPDENETNDQTPLITSTTSRSYTKD